jgi:hypothetical protein
MLCGARGLTTFSAFHATFKALTNEKIKRRKEKWTLGGTESYLATTKVEMEITKVEITKVEITKVEITKVEITKVEITKVEITKVEITKVEKKRRKTSRIWQKTRKNSSIT